MDTGSVTEGDWVALLDGAVIASAGSLAELASAVGALGVEPGAVLRCGPSDMPGAP